MANPTRVADRAAPQASSSWTDPVTGVVEETTFLQVGDEKIIAFLHRPTDRPVIAGVALCSSLYEDLQVNYRREMLVARELARRGFATVRFNYRSAGNSDDLREGPISFDTMRADAHAAIAWLTERAGAVPLVVGGSRLGALLAVDLATRDETTPLLLWGPMISGADYFKGMSRASKLAGVRAEARKRKGTGSAEGLFDEADAVEMLGTLVHKTSYEDFRARSLPASMTPGRPVLLIEIGLGEEVSPPFRDLAAAWQAGGADVELLKVVSRQQWFVPERWEPEDDKPRTTALVAAVPAWVEGLSWPTP